MSSLIPHIKISLHWEWPIQCLHRHFPAVTCSPVYTINWKLSISFYLISMIKLVHTHMIMTAKTVNEVQHTVPMLEAEVPPALSKQDLQDLEKLK